MVEFVYAAARLRAIENNLPNDNQILRMINAPSFEDAFNILASETSYAEKEDRIGKAFDFESLLVLELLETRKLLMSFAPKNELLVVFWEKHDLAKKSDEAYLKKMELSAEKHSSPIFKKYAEGFILLNRLKISAMDGKFNPETTLQKYRYSDFAKALQSGLADFEKTGSLASLEREIDNYLMSVVKKAKYLIFGIERLIGFAVAKELEVKSLRLVLTAKFLRIKPEEIKKRMRISYG